MRQAIVELPTYVQARVPDAILPVEYTSAVRAVIACRSIDESKYWADKADALAAWAKIYKQDQAAVESKRLKLHAYRRMSEIADELQPDRRIKGAGGGQHPGPRALLLSHGLSPQAAKYIRRIGAIPREKFDTLIELPKPPGISAASELGVGHAGKGHRPSASAAWRLLNTGHNAGGVSLKRFVKHFCERHSARDLARGINPGEVIAAKKLLVTAQEWLDEFEQYLPKVHRT